MNLYTIFASAFRADLTEVENAHNTLIASQSLVELAAAPTQTCVGSWKEQGQDKARTELTFVIPVYENNLGEVAGLFINEFNQDAVLVVNPKNNKASLVNRDGSCVEIGTFTEISEEIAKETECYTYWQGKYWLAK